MKSKTLYLINTIRNACSEEDYDDLLAIFHPEEYSKEEMSEIYNKELGYNPIDYFKERSLKNIYSKIKSLKSIKNNEKIINCINDFENKIEKDVHKIINEEEAIAIGVNVITRLILARECDYLNADDVSDIFDILYDELKVDRESITYRIASKYNFGDYDYVKTASPFFKDIELIIEE